VYGVGLISWRDLATFDPPEVTPVIWACISDDRPWWRWGGGRRSGRGVPSTRLPTSGSMMRFCACVHRGRSVSGRLTPVRRGCERVGAALTSGLWRCGAVYQQQTNGDGRESV